MGNEAGWLNESACYMRKTQKSNMVKSSRQVYAVLNIK
jgi:hypothetical protein